MSADRGLGPVHHPKDLGVALAYEVGEVLRGTASTGSFPPETEAPVPGGGFPQEQGKKTANDLPKHEGQFWQTADSDGGSFGAGACLRDRIVKDRGAATLRLHHRGGRGHRPAIFS